MRLANAFWKSRAGRAWNSPSISAVFPVAVAMALSSIWAIRIWTGLVATVVQLFAWASTSTRSLNPATLKESSGTGAGRVSLVNQPFTVLAVRIGYRVPSA